jgi:hypothetical protein
VITSQQQKKEVQEEKQKGELSRLNYLKKNKWSKAEHLKNELKESREHNLRKKEQEVRSKQERIQDLKQKKPNTDRWRGGPGALKKDSQPSKATQETEKLAAENARLLEEINRLEKEEKRQLSSYHSSLCRKHQFLNEVVDLMNEKAETPQLPNLRQSLIELKRPAKSDLKLLSESQCTLLFTETRCTTPSTAPPNGRQASLLWCQTFRLPPLLMALRLGSRLHYKLEWKKQT